MNLLDLNDIHNAASDIAEGLNHLRYALDALSDDVPEPFNHSLFAFAVACENLTDKAIMIKDTSVI